MKRRSTCSLSAATLTIALFSTLVLGGCAQSCLDDPIDESFTVVEVEGQVTSSRVLVDEWSTNINLVAMSTDSGPVEFELSGRPSLIEVGESYHCLLYTSPSPRDA